MTPDHDLTPPDKDGPDWYASPDEAPPHPLDEIARGAVESTPRAGGTPGASHAGDDGGGRVDRYHTTWWGATHAVGPGWRRLVARVFDALDALPVPRTLEALVRPPFWVYVAYDEGQLDLTVLPACPVAEEDARYVAAVLTDVYRESGRVCEACGAPALDAEPRRSTRTHCPRHAILWAVGMDEPVLWSRR